MFLCSVLYSEIVLSRKVFGIGHMYIYNFLLGMTDNMTSQNNDFSSWDTCISARPNVLGSSLIYQVTAPTPWSYVGF
jgi:hypothetical protein